MDLLLSLIPKNRLDMVFFWSNRYLEINFENLFQIFKYFVLYHLILYTNQSAISLFSNLSTSCWSRVDDVLKFSFVVLLFQGTDLVRRRDYFFFRSVFIKIMYQILHTHSHTQFNISIICQLKVFIFNVIDSCVCVS